MFLLLELLRVKSPCVCISAGDTRVSSEFAANVLVSPRSRINKHHQSLTDQIQPEQKRNAYPRDCIDLPIHGSGLQESLNRRKIEDRPGE